MGAVTVFPWGTNACTRTPVNVAIRQKSKDCLCCECCRFARHAESFMIIVVPEARTPDVLTV